MDRSEFWTQVMKVKSQHEKGLITALEELSEIEFLITKYFVDSLQA